MDLKGRKSEMARRIATGFYDFENVSNNGVKRIVISTNSKFADQFNYWKVHREAVNGLHNKLDLLKCSIILDRSKS